ncbi:MAG: diphthine--ammonia ligase [Candidatus ainarchaeum sp.]|nr:diphthine--ammonia ligase [Candidatus ainarchaeum sp.]
MRRAACLFSGGKDSVFSAFLAMSQGFEPFLLTMRGEEYSMMFHHPNVQWTELQARAMGLEHEFMDAGANELLSLENAIKNSGADAIFSGAIASDYQRQRIEQIGENLGIPTYSPLWHKDSALMGELSYFEIYVVSVSAEGLGPELLGKPFAVLAGKKNIHPFLEGGEGETFVANAPFFSKRIIIDEWEKKWDGVRGVAIIRKARLE